MATIVLNSDKPIGPNGLKGNISTEKNVTGTRGADSVCDELVEKINSLRSAAGVAPLTRCAPLDQAASDHVFDMNFNQYFDHYDLDNKSPMLRAQMTGYQLMARPIVVGEVIAWDRDTPQIAVDTWMASADNKAVLLDRAYADVGVACLQGASLAYRRAGLANWNKVWFWCVVLASGGICAGDSMTLSPTSEPRPYPTSGPVCFTDPDGFQACFEPPPPVL